MSILLFASILLLGLRSLQWKQGGRTNNNEEVHFTHGGISVLGIGWGEQKRKKETDEEI